MSNFFTVKESPSSGSGRAVGVCVRGGRLLPPPCTVVTASLSHLRRPRPQIQIRSVLLQNYTF